jgi:RNA polymerase sigma-70 factor (ECF subfamily)
MEDGPAGWLIAAGMQSAARLLRHKVGRRLMTAAEEFLRATLPASDLVFNLARRLVPDRADAEDLVQETYLRAWQAWSSGRPPRRVEPWLATICLNLGRDRARRAATRLEVPAELLAELADGTDVAAEAIHRVQRTQVERALWALPEPQRLAVVLMDLGGFTAAEAAGILGRPRGTVLAWVHRGRKALARAVREQEGDRHGS